MKAKKWGKGLFAQPQGFLQIQFYFTIHRSYLVNLPFQQTQKTLNLSILLLLLTQNFNGDMEFYASLTWNSFFPLKFYKKIN